MPVSVKETLNGAIIGRMEPAAQRSALGDVLNAAILDMAKCERIGPFRQDNVAASQAAVAITLAAVDAAAPTSIVAPRAGRIVGVTVRANADLTAGTMTLAPTIGGTAQAQTAVLSDTVQQKVSRFNTPISFVEGDLLGIKITTSADLAPATAEISADLLVDFSAGAVVVQDGLVPSSNVVTLAIKPTAVLDVNATAGTTAGRKKLRVGPVTGSNALAPATGEVIWDGGVKLLFSAVDAVTAVQVIATRTTDVVASIMQADVDVP